MSRCLFWCDWRSTETRQAFRVRDPHAAPVEQEKWVDAKGWHRELQLCLDCDGRRWVRRPYPLEGP